MSRDWPIKTMINTHSKQKAFTLIETLVAISILMIAIAGPLTVAAKGYAAAIDAKNQSIAANLAQEGLEYINYMKDNNDWPSGTTWAVNSRQPTDFASCSEYSNLCEFTGSLFTALPANITSRYYKFSKPTKDDFEQMLASVKVTWSTGTLTKSIEVQQIITNFQR